MPPHPHATGALTSPYCTTIARAGTWIRRFIDASRFFLFNTTLINRRARWRRP